MTKCLLYIAPIALIGLMATDAHAIPAAWGGGMPRDIATATKDATSAPLVLVRGGGRGGGGGFAAAVVAVIAAAGSPEAVQTAAVTPGEVRGRVLPEAVSTAGTSTAPTSTAGISTVPTSTAT